MQHKTRILATLMAFATISAALLSTACAPSQSFLSAASPEATQTATPTVTPSPSPTPSPTPTPSPLPTPELTKEQKILLLGINQNFEDLKVSQLNLYYYRINNVGRVVFVYTTQKEQDGVVLDTCYNVFNGEYLFSFANAESFKNYIKSI